MAHVPAQKKPSMPPLDLRHRLCALLRCCPPPPAPGRAVALRFRLTAFPHDAEGGLVTFDPGGTFMLLMTSTQKAGLSLDPRDAKGNPAPLDGTPSWTVADPNVATVEVAEDGLSATVIAAGVGTTQVNVVADARLGEEVKEISGVLEVQISPAEAVSLGISAGTPEEQA